MAEPIKVVVTGAAGQIAYSLLYQIASGEVFGRNQPLILHLLDIAPMMEVLQGVVMELEDCAFSLLSAVVPTTDPEVAFKDVSSAFLVGSMPRKQGMERKDLLSANVRIFKVQGEALDKFAKKDVKVLVVGNPANTNALICAKYAPSIPRENFSAMTRLDQNRAQAQLAGKLQVPVSTIRNVIIWGNHSSTQFPDAASATVTNGGKEEKITNLIQDAAYVQGKFVETVQKRGAAVIAARKMSSAMSAAKAASDHMRDWWCGTAPGSFVSMGVYSDGSYGVPKDIVYSFPVSVSNKKWSIVQNLAVDDNARKMLDATAKELLEEKEEALLVCQD
ncbi:malate dehydrogenase 1 [Arctopsyche grandis]|uniref:malate dehydrogenase 1 n=1 Tax=Arctopsyche grandis TaxID=121162 RepID=UPI00406D730A